VFFLFTLKSSYAWVSRSRPVYRARGGRVIY
jgi:hypothetical protein